MALWIRSSRSQVYTVRHSDEDNKFYVWTHCLTAIDPPGVPINMGLEPSAPWAILLTDATVRGSPLSFVPQ